MLTPNPKINNIINTFAVLVGYVGLRINYALNLFNLNENKYKLMIKSNLMQI